MSTHKHTPGPWFVCPDGLTVCDKRVWFDEAGARHGDTPNMVIKAMSAADAALISAAPELLEALDGMLQIYGGSKDWNGIKSSTELDCISQARAAIAKATGGEA